MGPRRGTLWPFFPPRRAALADAVLSSGALNLCIGTATTPTSQKDAINPADQALALTGTWLEV